MKSSSLFTSILDFPVGFADPFTVSTGSAVLGQFGPGQSVDFTRFGGGVTEFTVTGISPLADAANPVAFPLQLGFNTPTATFEMQPVINTDNVPPIADAGADQTVIEGAVVTLNGTASSDPDNDRLSFTWSQVSGPTVALSANNLSMPAFTAPTVGPQGATLKFSLVVNDGKQNSDPSVVTITVQNVDDPPRCDLARPSLSTLWPPNRNLNLINIIGVSDPNNDQVLLTITGTTQDEPVNGLGDGDTSPDAVIDGPAVWLRAERAGNGNGRIYRVNFTADDGQGGVCTAQ
jgi:hypothetical protein